MAGRVAIIVDGSPNVLLLPMTFWSGFQAAEDHYERFLYVSAVRLIRFLLAVLSCLLPSIYVALTTFHPQMIPFALVEMMDQFTRNTDTRMRTDIFVVNNGEGKDVLKINSPFNQFSAIVAVDQDRFCRLGDTALRDVLLDIGRDGIRPSMPMVDITPNNEHEKLETIEVKSVVIFNRNLQMVGKVSGRESLEMFWVKGVLKEQFVTEEIEEGSIALYESNLKRSIRTQLAGNKIKAYVKLEGTGRVLENNTDIDVSVSAERIPLERKLNEIKAKQVEETIKKLQLQYGQDVIGIGEEIHREHPYLWKELRKRWDELFPTVEVAVDVKLKLQNSGDIGKRIPGIGERK